MGKDNELWTWVSDSDPFSWFLGEQAEYFQLGSFVPSCAVNNLLIQYVLFSFLPNFAAPKRKKPRLVKYDAKYEEAKSSLLTAQSNPISSAAKVPADQPAKTEASSGTLEKIAGSAAENGGIASDTAQSHAVPAPTMEAQPEPMKVENNLVSDSKPVAEKSESRDMGLTKDEPQSPKKESPGLRLDDKHEIVTSTTKS